MAETVQHVYTSLDEMRVVFGQLGIQVRLDDDDYGELTTEAGTFLHAIIVQATDECNSYLLQHYNPEELVESAWVRMRCTWIACHILSRRRGNASQFQDEYDRFLQDFVKIRSGRDHIPRLKKKHDFSPSLSNLVIDYRYRNSSIRVDQETQVGDSGDQNHDEELYGGRY